MWQSQNVNVTSNAASSASSTSTERKNKTELGKDDFLKLLITQLTTQDPLQPLEDKDFIAQMAQFSTLEQMTNMNKALENLAMVNKTSALSLMGKDITYANSDGKETKGKVTGVRFLDNQVVLTMGTATTTLDKLISVSA